MVVTRWTLVLSLFPVAQAFVSQYANQASCLLVSPLASRIRHQGDRSRRTRIGTRTNTRISESGVDGTTTSTQGFVDSNRIDNGSNSYTSMVATPNMTVVLGSSSPTPTGLQPNQHEQQNQQHEHNQQDISVTVVDGYPTSLDSSTTTSITTTQTTATRHTGWRRRLRRALPGYKGEDVVVPGLDRMILTTVVPSMINLAVVPLVNSVDTFWVGRMGLALALAGQAAANQAFFTLYFLVAFLPTITAPLVATAVGSGNQQEAQTRVSESLFLCTLLGGLGTLLLVGFPETSLGLVLPPGAPAYEYAKPYLRIRGLGVIPALLSATGFAAYRGMLDTVTPLKVSLGTNLLNLVLDPLLIFVSPLGFVGAALATILSEITSGMAYLHLLLKQKLTTMRLLFTPPPLKSILPILQGGLSILGRQAALNIGILYAARQAQSMDPASGVAAAAYGIVMQLHSLGIVLHVAMQSTAATLVPAALAKSGKTKARQVGDRIFGWGSLLGLCLGVTQVLALPFIVPLFSTLPEVQAAVRAPATISALLHIINGPVFAGEGVMLGLSCFRDLMIVTATGIATMMGSLWILGSRAQLNGILWSFVLFSSLQALAVVGHYVRVGPLAVQKQ